MTSLRGGDMRERMSQRAFCSQYERWASTVEMLIHAVESGRIEILASATAGRHRSRLMPAMNSRHATRNKTHCPMPPASIQWRVVAHGAQVSLPQLKSSVQFDIMPKPFTNQPKLPNIADANPPRNAGSTTVHAGQVLWPRSGGRFTS
jgi:hypothetical protein